MKGETTESKRNDIKMVADNNKRQKVTGVSLGSVKEKSGRACRRDESLEDWQVPTRGYGIILTLTITDWKKEGTETT